MSATVGQKRGKWHRLCNEQLPHTSLTKHKSKESSGSPLFLSSLLPCLLLSAVSDIQRAGPWNLSLEESYCDWPVLLLINVSIICLVFEIKYLFIAIRNWGVWWEIWWWGPQKRVCGWYEVCGPCAIHHCHQCKTPCFSSISLLWVLNRADPQMLSFLRGCQTVLTSSNKSTYL